MSLHNLYSVYDGPVCLLLFFFPVLRITHRALGMLGKCSNVELHPKPVNRIEKRALLSLSFPQETGILFPVLLVGTLASFFVKLELSGVRNHN